VIVLKRAMVDVQLDGAVRAVILTRTASQWGLACQGCV